ncbi:hypothetical protein J4Q44_G00295080 [Coregonus suidteri]|uniref:Uncharacterized protein n=1 Tax=Coregonus suidteri TaxID=861788 RepID=A0AAN8L1N3_9TELE
MFLTSRPDEDLLDAMATGAVASPAFKKNQNGASQTRKRPEELGNQLCDTGEKQERPERRTRSLSWAVRSPRLIIILSYGSC